MSNPPSHRPCLLLVDDTPANIAILVDLLKADFELKVATRGAQALRICAKVESIDLILLDVMMPEMDGYEVCQRLRADAATHDIPIIFLTAKTEVDDIVRGFEIGANDYVTKPFRPAELLARVRTHLMIRAQQREIAEKSTELKEMLHIVCHDVANQFAVANLSLELVVRNPEQNMSRFLPRILAAVKNGIGLTNLVREMRRSEDKQLTLQPVALRDAFAESLLLIDSRTEAKKLVVKVEVPEVNVAAEPSALINSVFSNIFTNAVKFSHEGGVIEVGGEVQDGMVCVSIRDHGIGMPPPLLEHIFDITKGTSRKGTAGEKGTGFGMPLMHKFVTQFGGKVEVESREATDHPEDHGTEFRIWLNLA